MTHRPVDCDLIHDSLDGVSEMHHNLTPEQVELLRILGWPQCCPTSARLTTRQTATLTDLIAWRHRPVIPVPRPPADQSCAT